MSIWFDSRDVSVLNLAGRDTLFSHLGIEVTEIGEDFVAGRMPVDHRTRQPYGLLHGGASVSLAESLGSCAAALTVDPARFFVVGQDINAHYLRSLRSGWVHGVARPVHLGGRTQVWNIDLRGDDGRLTSVARLTLAVVPREQIEGRNP